jgi:hypothetical protein
VSAFIVFLGLGLTLALLWALKPGPISLAHGASPVDGWALQP